MLGSTATEERGLESLEKITLSLKNIYRLLMNDDFPIYSERVISKKQRRGQTLLRFWQDMMAHEFCCLTYGKLIWRNDGTRNRYISNLCNRNDDLKYYHEYAKELGSQISVEALLNQIRRFEDFLQSREYNNEALQYRVNGFLCVLKEDSCVTDAIGAHLEEIFLAAKAASVCGAEGSTFHAAYLLTVMTVYAAAGTAMGDPTMALLREEVFCAKNLWEENCREQAHSSRDVRILTAHAGLLQDNSLSKDRFFGREAELFDLRDMVISGKKCLISGIGGVGKTELLRQLIRRCCEDHMVDKLAIIPYRTDLACSLVYAFPTLRQQNQEETLQYALHRLEKEAQEGKLLLLLDDVANDTDTDANLLRLAQLPCAVVATSRRKHLEGFKTYPLSAPNADACALIFRDNYGSPLSDADRGELSKLLAHPGICHPLALQLMARAARSKNWSVGALHRSLLCGDTALTWVEAGRQIRIEQVLAQLYPANHIPESCQTVMQLFTLLPHDSYQIDLLLEDFPLLFRNREDLERDLVMLVENSWLEQDDGGYSMHPLIAQCLRRKTLPQSYLERFLFGLRQKLCSSDAPGWDAGERLRVGQIFISITDFLTGSIRASLLLELMDAILAQCPTKQQAEQYQKQLQTMLRRCPDRDDTVEVLWHTLLCRWDLDAGDAVQAVFEKQLQQRSVPVSRFLDFCISANTQLCTTRPELAERMFRAVLEADATARQKAVAYYGLITIAEYGGKSETALQWGQTGATFVLQHPECGQMQAFDILGGLAALHLKFGQAEEAKPLLDEMGKLEKTIAMPSVTIQYQMSVGTYELYYGDLGKAAEMVEKALVVLDEYYGKDINYYTSLNQLAIILQRQKRFDQAKAAYEQILSFGKNQVYFGLARNNYAVLLLDMGKPEEAMPHIAEVLAAARQQGGIALGEALRNMARAHGLLGEYEQELACLQEALPLLEQAYGPEHPRAAAARERLALLHGQQ